MILVWYCVFNRTTDFKVMIRRVKDILIDCNRNTSQDFDIQRLQGQAIIIKVRMSFFSSLFFSFGRRVGVCGDKEDE